ncbi:MAG: filamentous hemagglutinin N-terminal domain-containing protein [Rhodoferax sp.]|uniref:two-partner secretion domain-containing protein n=1 Tax=Rhodoferax sp. TaxID=50421 RepID=UPI001B75E945|nr:filamentous hemagglutinin N-terminal domain-containing protein [Rhodoferax sp.]MBP9737201.1 filamentous hemagglutinin N-terminal domain-containing protein [Rhodoferax sp.]
MQNNFGLLRAHIPAKPRLTSNFSLTCLSMALLCAFSPRSNALPNEGVVASGNATISSTSAANLTITQNSQNAVLNWQGFTIGAKQSVQFIQPNSNAVVLNRVLGADPSRILGSLTANGKVFLVNPNGIFFGKNSSVNVGGLVASALDISNADFLAGRYRFSGPGNGEIRNLGNIRADDGGYVVLFGNQASNEGNITARLGTVALAAGSAMTLGIAEDGLINIAVDQKALHALASNSGLLQADGGQIFLSAQAKDAMIEKVVNTTGIVQAASVGYRNGRVVLDGGDSGIVHVGGEVRTVGTEAMTTGGAIVAMGDKVLIDDQAHLDATGVSGGGGIYVGGGWQGGDPVIRQASAVYVAPSATLDASAKQSGDGGTVVAWSDIHNPQSTTRVYGTLLARAGSERGNGGRIETSGKWIDVAGLRADASAPLGTAGVWLLDPDDLTISAAVTTTPAGPPGFFAPGVGPANVQNTDIEAILNTGTPVVLDTASGGAGAGNISINASITKTAGGPAALGLFADGAITLNPAIGITSAVGALDVTLNAVNGVTLGAGSSIASNGGEIFIYGPTFTNNAGAGALSAGAGRWIVYSNNPTTNVFGGLNSGNKAIWGQNPGTLPPGPPGPGSAPGGNRYVFSTTGTVLATTTDFVKNYGQSLSVASGVIYSGAPLTSAATHGNVYQNLVISDVLTNFPSVSSAGEAATASVAGSPYAVVAAGGLASSGYSISYSNSGTVQINPASLSITAASDNKTYNAVPYTGGNGVSYSGFMGADTVASLTGTLSFGGTSQGAVNAGTYTIVPSGLSGSNYAITYGSGTLTISPKVVSVAGLIAEDKEYDGNADARIRDWGGVTTGVGSQTLVVNQGSASFDDPTIGINKTVTARGYTLANGANGGLASNYQLTSSTAATTATIAPLKQPAAVSSLASAITVTWRIGDRSGELEIQPRDIDPDLWVVQEPQATKTNNTITDTGQSASSNAASNGAAGAVSTPASALSSAGFTSSGGSTIASSASSTPAASRPPTRLSATGFAGVVNPGVAASSRPPNAVNQPVMLTGIDRAAIVGTTGGGAAVIAAQSKGVTTIRLAVTVAPDDSFEISLPPSLMGVLNVRGSTPKTEAISLITPLPDWIVFDRATMKFSAARVPAAGALPVTVKLRAASGKAVEVTFQ